MSLSLDFQPLLEISPKLIELFSILASLGLSALIITLIISKKSRK